MTQIAIEDENLKQNYHLANEILSQKVTKGKQVSFFHLNKRT